jgi:hypothetical protein
VRVEHRLLSCLDSDPPLCSFGEAKSLQREGVAFMCTFSSHARHLTSVLLRTLPVVCVLDQEGLCSPVGSNQELSGSSGFPLPPC